MLIGLLAPPSEYWHPHLKVLATDLLTGVGTGVGIAFENESPSGGLEGTGQGLLCYICHSVI